MKRFCIVSTIVVSLLCVLGSVCIDDSCAQESAGPAKAHELQATDPEKAAALFSKYVKENPMASDAAQAKFQEGLSYEAIGDYYQAFKAYQHIIDNYPLYPNVDELLDRQYRIGNYYLLVSTKPTGFNPLKMLAGDKTRAVEIFEQVVRNAPFTEVGAKAQYRLAYTHMQMKEYLEAIDEYTIVLEKYPGSGYVDDTVYGLATSYFSLVQGPQYDKYSTEKALQYYNRYLNEFPHGRYRAEIMPKIGKLNQNLAEGIYMIGEFYEARHRYEAALIYYDELERRYGDTFYAEKARSKRSILEAIVKSEIPYREINRNYRDAIGLYYAIKRKDTRNPWEFWRRDPLTPDERRRLEWARKLIEVAKQHKKEAKQLFDIEKELIVLELEIRDLKKDTQRLKAKLPTEHAVLDQLNSGVIPEDAQQRLMPEWLYDTQEQRDLKRLQRKQRIRIRKMENQIESNEKRVVKLGKELAEKQQEFEANRPEFERRKTSLLERAQKVRNELDLLLAGSDEYASTEIGDIKLSPVERQKIAGKPAAPGVPADEQVPPEEKPEVLKRLAEEAAGRQNVLIPYENQLRDTSWDYWWKVLVGEEDRVRTPKDAVEFLINE